MVIYTCPKCGVDLTPVVYATYPPIEGYLCSHCGWASEVHRKNFSIHRVPFPAVKESDFE